MKNAPVEPFSISSIRYWCTHGFESPRSEGSQLSYAMIWGPLSSIARAEKKVQTQRGKRFSLGLGEL